MMQYVEVFNHNFMLSFVIPPQSDPARGQVQFCHNLIANLSEKGNSPGTQEFPELRIKRHFTEYSLLKFYQHNHTKHCIKYKIMR